MTQLVPARRSSLSSSRVVGTPAHWAGGTALFGGLVGWSAIMSVLVFALLTGGVTFAQMLVLPVPWITGLVGMALGGVIGAWQPAFLDRVRGRVRLPVLAVRQAMVGAAAGAVGGTATFLQLVALSGWPPSDVALIVGMMALSGAVVGAVSTLAWWLPFTMAMVLGRRTWPVTVAVAATVPPLLTVLVTQLL